MKTAAAGSGPPLPSRATLARLKMAETKAETEGNSMPKEIVTVTVVVVEFDGDSEVLNQRVEENETVDGVIGNLRQEMLDQMEGRSIAAIFTHVDRVILPDPVISQATDATQNAQQVGTRSQ